MSAELHTLEVRVEEALHQIRPYLKADGGDIALEELTPDLTARVRLLGACSSCSMSLMTMKAGVEEAIKRAVPEIKHVEAVNMPDPAEATPFGK